MSSAAPAFSPEIIAKHGLTPDEYERIVKILGRQPNITELGIFSVMWSEHCSYKNSRPELKNFPTTGPTVLVKAGEENAGVIDIGDGWAVAFKIESHNHPSAVEPFQGAATGVGGILRDIFTMGARPVFNLNSLRFGEIRGDSPASRNNRRLLAGVVGGISHYGNCTGIPTVGGEVQFDDSYTGNPLVNAFCLGILRHDQIRLGKATGSGNPVFYVGARTGRDGLAGAAFASRDLTEGSKADRPAVQVGDPFIGKLLMEACLELYTHPEAIVGIQDMGAAGLTCSTCETASRGGTGVEIDLQFVPQREPNMTPYEVMLSESQERMLIIVHKGQEQTVLDIFEKWDLPVAEIGRVTDDGMMRVKDHGVTVAEIPASSLTDEAPIYQREAKVPAGQAELNRFDLAELPEPKDYQKTVLDLIAAPSLASKRWVYRQYDHMVRVGTVVAPGSDAAVIRIPTGDKPKYLAATVDCNARYVLLDPRAGGRIAVAEAARNLAMSGARPIGVTDNLNFGNPHNPEIFWQLKESVQGIAEACRFFDVPVTGGNVSLYNQSPAGAVDPTPTIGMVGLIDDEKHITTMGFKQADDIIVLLGGWGSEMGGTSYAQEIHKVKRGTPPQLDLGQERHFQKTVLELIRQGWVKSAHDLSEAGLALAAVESCLGASPALGAVIDLPGTDRLDTLLFNETQGRALLTVSVENLQAFLDFAAGQGIAAARIGTVGGQELAFQRPNGRLAWKLSELESAWGESLERIMA
jgi:phosphoribosylformylglycinamidine synthase II